MVSPYENTVDHYSVIRRVFQRPQAGGKPARQYPWPNPQVGFRHHGWVTNLAGHIPLRNSLIPILDFHKIPPVLNGAAVFIVEFHGPGIAQVGQRRSRQA